jgi:hypothetical protein
VRSGERRVGEESGERRAGRGEREGRKGDLEENKPKLASTSLPAISCCSCFIVYNCFSRLLVYSICSNTLF